MSIELVEEEIKNKDFAALSVDNALKLLHVTRDGLSLREVEERRNLFGKNILYSSSKNSFIKIFLSQFTSPLVIILIFATIISALLQEFLDAFAILIILVLNAFLGSIQEYKAENALESLKKMSSFKVKVLRSGKEVIIDSSELVVGDILFLEEGMLIPADARIIESHGLKVMESILTGESSPVYKQVDPVDTSILGEKKSMVFRGCAIVEGYGLAVVTAVGMNTELGKIAKHVSTIKRVKTHLEEKLEQLSKSLGIFTLGIALFIFFIYALFVDTSTINALLVGISLAVAAIPEGLPAVVTISLSLGASRMAKKKALMRRLASIENLGAVTVICTDKTGTLTRNELTVKKIFDGEKEIDVSGNGYSTLGSFSLSPPKKLLFAGIMSSTATINPISGDPTEIALVVLAAKDKVYRKDLERIGIVSFNSERKMMSIAYKQGDSGILYSKGAPEVLIEKCRYVEINGERKPLTDSLKKMFLDKSMSYAKQALRVLAVAYREIPLVNEQELVNYENDLVLLGIVGMIDPPREEVKDAIMKCKEAGIRVIMITGDHIETAKAIGEEIGIEGRAILGSEINNIDLDKELDNISIFARVNPEHKLMIVNALKKKGHIVAMTGDGVNDAPAIKRADIGIAVGSGTDVAKEAAEMVILDDNFATIVNAIEEGRGIYQNIKKFVNYLLSANLGEVIAIGLAGIFALLDPKIFGEVLLTAIQLLWLNLLTDSLPALALGVDPTPKNIMKRPPLNPKEGVIDREMKFSIGYTGLFIGIVVLLSFATRMPQLYEARTVALTTLVLMELARIALIKINYKESLFNNKYLVLAMIGTIVLQLIAVYSPLNHYLGLVPLNWFDWIIILGFVFLVFVFSLLLHTLTKLLLRELS